jgi:hypothetical protein
MATYARIANGTVVEIFATTGNIGQMFHPSLEWVDITAQNPQPQVGWTYSGGAFAAPPAAPAPTPAQQALVALGAGCAITSASNPQLNATYPIDPATQTRIIGVQARINAGLGLPNGAATITWLDINGAPHHFTAAQFTAFAAGVSDYVYGLDLVMAGQGTTLPTQPVGIA